MSTPSKASRAREVFEEVVELPDDARAASLSERCAGDDELKRLVLELLEADAAAEHGQFLARTPTADLTGAQIGGYKVLRAIGSGGMGTVYVAEQDQPRRNVALKVLQPIFRSSSVLRRFRVESEILARLQHPGIAQVFDAGVHEFSGEGFRLTLPWYALEYLEGAATLTQYAQRAKLDVPARVRLLADVCAAVHHAHQKGVIHRDLKPANLLVGHDGRAKVIDFGVARVATTEGASTLHTMSGELLGTVRYMAPEQLAGDPDAVDTRSDVYALGVILFELLTGKAPLDLDGKSVTDAARIVRDEAPKRLRSIDPALPQDLEWICAKALEKEPARRFASAGEFVADLERFLNGEPALSGPPSATYRVSVFVRRHRVLVFALAAVIVALTTGLVVALFAVDKANRAETRANDEATASKASEQRAKLAEETATKDAKVATGVVELISKTFSSAMAGDAGHDLKVVDALRLAAEGMRTGLADSPDAAASIENELARLFWSLGEFDSAIAANESALDRLRKAGLGETRLAVKVLSNLSEAHLQAGHLKETEAIVAEFSALARRVLPADDPLHLRAIHQQGSDLYRRGKIKDSEPFFRDAYERRTKALGPEAVDTLESLNSLALTLMDEERFDEAEPLARTFAETCARVFGPESPAALTGRNNVASLLCDLQRYDEAIAEYAEIAEIQAHVLTPMHPSTLLSRMNHANAVRMKKDYAQSIPLMRAVIADMTESQGAGYPQRLHGVRLLANDLIVTGSIDEAIEVARDGLAAAIQALGKENGKTVGLEGVLGLALSKKGELDEAEGLLLHAHEFLAKNSGASARDTRSLARYLRELYRKRNDPENEAKFAALAEP